MQNLEARPPLFLVIITKVIQIEEYSLLDSLLK